MIQNIVTKEKDNIKKVERKKEKMTNKKIRALDL